jgi:penicillin-insensitive murein endopeptidase
MSTKKNLESHVTALIEQNKLMAEQNKRLLEKMEEMQHNQRERAPVPGRRSPSPPAAVRRSPRKHTPKKHTPIRRSPKKHTPINQRERAPVPDRRSPSPPAVVRRSPRKHTPKKHTPIRRSPKKHTPIRRSPKKHTPIRRSPKKHTPRKRKSATPKNQTVRKSIGYALKQNFDEDILSQQFRDEDRFFLVEEFTHAIKPLIIAIEDDEEIDTSAFTRRELNKLAVDVAKKRGRYTPKGRKKHPKKPTKVNMELIKRRATAAAATAAAAASAAASSGTKTNDDVPNHDDVDDDAGPNDDVSDASDDVFAYMACDAKAQKERELLKESLESKKSEAAKDRHAAIIEKHQKGEAKKAVARSKRKSAKKKKEMAKTKTKTKESDCELRLGMSVHGFWPDDHGDSGKWFEGVVEGIDYEERTVHVLYDDGDRDDSLPWAKCRILDKEYHLNKKST